MKNFTLILSLLLCSGFANEALTSYEGPLLEKRQVPGFAPEEESLGSLCEVYANRLIIRKHVGTLSVSEERKIVLDLEKLIELIHGASKGKIAGRRSEIADAPYTVYRAYKVLSNDGVEDVFLREEFASVVGKWNTSREARQLRYFLDQLCD